MKRNTYIVGVLAALVPGMGHIYIGKKALGVAFLLAFIIIGNLNAIWLSIFAGAQTDLSFMGYTLPRVLHDVFAAYGIIFWVWQTYDAVRLSREPA